MIERVEIDLDGPLSPGDIIELHFETIGMTYIKAAQMALIEWLLRNRKEFRILSWSIPTPTTAIFEVQVLKTNPILITASVIGAIIITAGLIFFISLKTAYKIVESPTGSLALGGFGALAMVAAIAGLIMLLPKR